MRAAAAAAAPAMLRDAPRYGMPRDLARRVADASRSGSS
jgi:hypothetical protein